MKKLETFDFSYFRIKSHFEEDGTQIYLVFQPINKYFKTIAGVGNASYIYYWQCKGLSDEKINYIKTPNQNITPSLEYHGTKTIVRFNGSCLKQDQVTFNHGKIVNIYIVYELSMLEVGRFFKLENCSFGAVSLTINADIDKYKYSGYGIEFDRLGSFSHPSGGTGRNVIIFGVDMSSSTKIDNKKKDILIFSEGSTQGLQHQLSAEKMYSVNFTEHRKKFCLSFHWYGSNNYLFVNGKETHKNTLTPLCLGNISKDWSVYNMKETGLNGYVYDFSVDYDAIAVSDISDIHKYLMKKNKIV